MLKVTEYLKTNSLQSLVDKFSLKATRHKKYPNLVLLKYNQIDTPKNDLTDECRGIILDESDNWKVVSFGYKRFYNYGEDRAAEIDWNNTKVFSKEDGSLMTLYHYDGQWQVSSSGVPDASGEIMGTETTFADLFWKTWKDLGYELPSNPGMCYMFELCTPLNRVIVRHKKSRIVLHGVRRLCDLHELNSVVEARCYGWEHVKSFPLQSLNDILVVAKELDPMEAEGYVVRDINYNRIKVKSPAYCAISHIRDGFSTRRLLEIIRTNEHSEFLTYFPEHTGLYNEIKLKIEYLVGEIEGFYNAIKHINDRKQFALLAKDQKFSGILFGLKYSKTESVRSALSDMNIKYLEELLGTKSIQII